MVQSVDAYYHTGSSEDLSAHTLLRLIHLFVRLRNPVLEPELKHFENCLHSSHIRDSFNRSQITVLEEDGNSEGRHGAADQELEGLELAVE